MYLLECDALVRLLTFNLHEQGVDLMARYVILCIHWSGPMWCSWDGLTPPLILKLLPLCPWKPGGRCAHMKSPLLLCGEISCSLSSFSGLNLYFAVQWPTRNWQKLYQKSTKNHKILTTNCFVMSFHLWLISCLFTWVDFSFESLII